MQYRKGHALQDDREFDDDKQFYFYGPVSGAYFSRMTGERSRYDVRNRSEQLREHLRNYHPLYE
jgi:hypothetical protein